MLKALDILKHYWGYDEFRSPQNEIIDAIISHNDVLAVLPTGFGKSLTFQVPELMHDEGVCLVISPLIALIKDQVTNLEQKGIKAIALIGSMSLPDTTRIIDNVRYGNVKFLYIAPERLKSTVFQEQMKYLPVNMIVIDEAHCISEWGHDFRPSYLELYKLKEIFPDVPMAAFTATATPRVVDDIKTYLKLKNPKFFKRSSVRDNIVYKVFEEQDKNGALLSYLQNNKGVSIVYVGSRKMVEFTSEFLNFKGLKSNFYHAGLDAKQKQIVYQEWMSEKTPIIVATNAFGMGIDKPNVRSVIHLSLPSSIENYMQESGRAGRDGKTSEAIIIEEPADFLASESIYLKSQPDPEFITKVYNHINQYFKIALGTLPEHSFSFDLNEFCHIYKLPILKTYYSFEILEREGVFIFSSSNNALHKVKVLLEGNQLFEFYDKNPKREDIVKTLLRNYDSIFDRYVVINPMLIANKTGNSYENILKQLKLLKNDQIIDYKYVTNQSEISFLLPREDQYTLGRLLTNVKKHLDHNKKKYQAMIDYVTNKEVCRVIQLANYFDENITGECGQCDVCLTKQKKKNSKSDLKKSLINILKSKGTINEKELIHEFGDKNNVIDLLRLLLDDGLIKRTSNGDIHWLT